MPETKCAIMSKAQALALEQGLPLHQILCIYSQICNGLTCAMITPLTTQEVGDLKKRQVDAFYQRLGKTAQLQSKRNRH